MDKSEKFKELLKTYGFCFQFKDAKYKNRMHFKEKFEEAESELIKMYEEELNEKE